MPVDGDGSLALFAHAHAAVVRRSSDLKPMLGVLLPELLAGCGWWGYMQERASISRPDGTAC